jgi:hypothetical protein
MNALTVAALLLAVGCAGKVVPQASPRPNVPGGMPQAGGTQLSPAPPPSTTATPVDAGDASSPPVDAASDSQEPRPPDPPGETMAQTIANVLRRSAASGQGIPAPRPAGDNNFGALVRPAAEIAAEIPHYARSHDAKQLAFVRVDGASAALWTADSDGTHARPVFDTSTGKAKLPEGNVGSLPSDSIMDLRFTRDDRGLFFQTDGWATSLALYRLDFRTNKAGFVIDANGYSVIDECPKQRSLEGKVIAYRHSYSTLLVTAIDLYFLVDGSGKVHGVVGPEPENVERFLQTQCAGAKPALPPAPTIPAHLTELPACGRGNVLRYDPVHFLDGTVLPVFYVVRRGSARVSLKSLDLDALVNGPVFLEDLSKGLQALCGH